MHYSGICFLCLKLQPFNWTLLFVFHIIICIMVTLRDLSSDQCPIVQGATWTVSKRPSLQLRAYNQEEIKQLKRVEESEYYCLHFKDEEWKDR